MLLKMYLKVGDNKQYDTVRYIPNRQQGIIQEEFSNGPRMAKCNNKTMRNNEKCTVLSGPVLAILMKLQIIGMCVYCKTSVGHI